VPQVLKNLQNPDPQPNALPDLRALQRFIKRETVGFPIPDSLPQAAYAKEPVPVSQAAEAKKPTSLKDLFKK